MDVALMDNDESPSAVGTDAPASERETLVRCLAMLKRARVADGRWRARAKESVEFYFGKQWKGTDKATVEARGQAAIVVNRIKPTIRLVHGLVVSQPMDWLAKPVGRNDDAAADRATSALKYVANCNDLKAIEERVYQDALSYGVGWAMAGLRIKNRDRRAEPVQVRRLDPREVRLDPQCQEADISDARFVVWSRKVDLTDAVASYPEYEAKLREHVGTTDPNLDATAPSTYSGTHDSTPPVKLWKEITEGWDDWNQIDRDEDGSAKQVVMHELWERYPVTVTLAQRRDGTFEEVDLDTPEGVALITDPDTVWWGEDTVMKVRYFVFVGTCLLKQEASPYKHDRLPFVPCWNERDQHGDPVSFIESLKDLQREINHRRSRALYELGNNPLVMTKEFLDANGMTPQQAGDHAAEQGAVWVGPLNGIQYLNKPQTASGQFQAEQEAKAEIQFVSGANDPLMGYDGNAQSGKAKEIQMQQGQTMMRPTEANLRAFHRQLGEMVLMLIQQAHTEEWLVRVRDEVGKDRFITINQRVTDPVTGATQVLNTLDGYRFELEIDATPWTPTLRERTSSLIADLSAQEQDPMVRLSLKRLAIQVSDMPEKASVLEVLDQAISAAVGQMQAAAQAPAPMGPAAAMGAMPEPGDVGPQMEQMMAA